MSYAVILPFIISMAVHAQEKSIICFYKDAVQNSTASREFTFDDARRGAELLTTNIDRVRYVVSLGDMSNGLVRDTLSISATAEQDTKIKTEAGVTSTEFSYRGAMTDGSILTYADEINKVFIKCEKR